MHTEIITGQIIILTILVLIGTGAVWFKVFSEGMMEGLAKLVFNITLPLLIFTNLTELEFTKQIIKNGGLVIFFTFFSLGVMYLMGSISSRIQFLKPRIRAIHLMHTMFGNIVFLGYPLIDAIYPGGEGLLYATLFHLVSSSLQWTVGVYLLAGGKEQGWLNQLKHLLNPNTMALVLGLIMMGIPVKLPSILLKSLGGLGETTIYLSMLYIGAILASTSLKGVFHKWYSIIVSLNKLIIIPFLLILIIKGMNNLLGLSMGKTAFEVVILQSAMPCMAIVVIMAKAYGADDKHATENVFLSTILALFTLPLVYFLLQKIG
ncbi:MAG: AEC family transporter [Bacteroidales bacterium]|nr:MAG: AEC family transporter [Bacteroidales bacterium]